MMVRLAFLIALLTAVPAFGQTEQGNCGPRHQLLGYLSDKFREVPIALGLTSDGNVLEVATANNGTWTIFVTQPTGVSCAIAAGQEWSKTTPPLQISEDDDED